MTIDTRSQAPRASVARAAPRRVNIAGIILSVVALSFVADRSRAEDALSDRAGIVKSEFIYEKASFPECHASTIVDTDGGLVAAWFGGTEEGNRDVGIWLSRHVDGRWHATNVAEGQR